MMQTWMDFTAASTKPPKPSSNRVVLSLFSGAGGLDVGFHRAGFRIAACVEIDKAACKTLELNRGRYIDADCKILNRDIRDVTPAEIGIGEVDFIIGGPPCQSFSAIGRRVGGVDGTQNPQGSLFEHYCRLVQHYQPRGFLFENVRGILGANKGQDWQQIVSAFASLGYTLSYRVLDCADYGVPQHRERLIMFGAKGLEIRFPRPTCGPNSEQQLPYVSALSAMADLQDENEPSHSYSGKYGALLAEVPAGNNYHYFTREMGYPQPVFAWRSRFSDFLYKADPDKPVRTVVASLGAYSGPFHWKNRKFTLPEFKRLQTFPDDYEFAGGMNAALKQLGNSVPPQFAEALANAVLGQVFAAGNDVELLAVGEPIQLDARKYNKAKATRTKRIMARSVASHLHNSVSGTQAVNESQTIELFWQYSSLRKRTPLLQPSPNLNVDIHRILVMRKGGCCEIEVSRYDNEGIGAEPLLRYNLYFHQPIGGSLQQIACTLISYQPEDIAIAWDVIEDYLASCSGYRTMMDVYGHFTEPHPIFSLQMEVLSKQSSFLLRFAETFSKFEATTKVLPGRMLEQMYEDSMGQRCDLTSLARYLRGLRFDVRVNQTNSTIAPGYFRCCYPFTININKQVSVAWKD